MAEAVSGLAHDILVIQGDGDYKRASEMLMKDGVVDELLAADLAKIQEENIPIDIRYRQGKEELGLSKK